MKKILIGKISSAFGIKGEVKVISYCQNPIDIEKYNLFDKNDVLLKLKITNKNRAVIGYSSNGTILIAKIEEINDRNAAENMRDVEIFADRKDFSALKKDEFYQADLIDLDVLDEDSKKIGKVLNVFDFGGGTMLEIEFEKSNPQKKLEKIENFPFKNEIFPEVDIENGFIKISLPSIISISDLR